MEFDTTFAHISSCLRGSAETGDGLHRGTLSYHIFSPIHYFLKGVHFHFLQTFPPSPLIALIKISLSWRNIIVEVQIAVKKEGSFKNVLFVCHTLYFNDLCKLAPELLIFSFSTFEIKCIAPICTSEGKVPNEQKLLQIVGNE